MIEAGWLDRLGRRGPRRRSGRLLTRDAEQEPRSSWDREPRRRGLRIPHPSVRVVAVIVVVLVLAGGVWLWLRDSSLVAVKHVTVTGASGPDAARIRSALDAAARNMTTLDVHMDTLNTVVEPFPVVKGLAGEHAIPARDEDPGHRGGTGRGDHLRRPPDRRGRRRHPSARRSRLPESSLRSRCAWRRGAPG